MFYGPVQQGNDLWNAAFFCGSCAVIRRSALMEIGGFAVETVTEDAHTAIKMQRKGWKSAFFVNSAGSGTGDGTTGTACDSAYPLGARDDADFPGR
ncbi:hypothetical protein DaDZ19_11310 [Dickeya ananatis]